MNLRLSFLDVCAAYGTVKLIKGVFENTRELYKVLREIGFDII